MLKMQQHFEKEYGVQKSSINRMQKIYYFCTYISGSQGKWKTSDSLWTNKRKKEMMLNCRNLKCFKTKYQLVNSIIQTLF